MPAWGSLKHRYRYVCDWAFPRATKSRESESLSGGWVPTRGFFFLLFFFKALRDCTMESVLKPGPWVDHLTAWEQVSGTSNNVRATMPLLPAWTESIKRKNPPWVGRQWMLEADGFGWNPRFPILVGPSRSHVPCLGQLPSVQENHKTYHTGHLGRNEAIHRSAWYGDCYAEVINVGHYYYYYIIMSTNYVTNTHT